MQNNTEIEINLIIDDCSEYAYCNSIDETIETLQHLKREEESVIENIFDKYISILDTEKKPLELYEKDIEIIKIILGKLNTENNYKGHKIIIKNERKEGQQDNNFKLDEIRFKEVSGRSDLEKFLKEPESYIFNSQKTGKPWSKEASQKIIRCRFCEYNRIGSGLRPCYSCKYNIKAEEVKEYEE